MIKKSFFSIFVVVFISSLIVPANAFDRWPTGYVNNGVTLTMEATTINISENTPKELNIYPSDPSGVRTYGADLAFWEDSQNNYTTGEFNPADGYGLNIKRKPRIVESSNYWTIIIDPKGIRGMKNGTYNLHIFELSKGSSQPIGLTINVNIDAKKENLYTTNFELKCSVAYFGADQSCTVTPNIQGDGKALVSGKYQINYEYLVVGQKKWVKGKPFSWDISQSVIFYPFKITKPTQLKVNVVFENQQYSLSKDSLKPYAKIELSAPGAAIVGDSFVLSATSNKNYSADCVVNNETMKFKIRNGFGRIQIYGVTPGNLTLYVSCKSSNWSDSGSSKFVYIRQ